MALYNAFRYNYSDSQRLLADHRHRRAHDEPHLHRAAQGLQPLASPTAAARSPRPIAKEFKEPFGAAEERKKRDGFVESRRRLRRTG